MVLTAFLAVVFASLREPSPVWANILFTSAFIVVSLATVAAIIGKRTVRVVATGYAVCGWGYFLLIYCIQADMSRFPLFPNMMIDSIIRATMNGNSDGLNTYFTVNAIATFVYGAGGGGFAWLLARYQAHLAPDRSNPASRDHP